MKRSWLTYLARSCYLLQQGRFAADVIYFYGEDSNITALFGEKPPDVPSGYSFDYVNADALVHRLSVSGGRITTPNGMSYRVLALDPNSRYMSLPVLRKIRDLVNAGVRKMYIATSTGDPYREANAALCKHLAKLGADVTTRAFPGPHDQPWLREVGVLDLVLWASRTLP